MTGSGWKLPSIIHSRRRCWWHTTRVQSITTVSRYYRGKRQHPLFFPREYPTSFFFPAQRWKKWRRICPRSFECQANKLAIFDATCVTAIVVDQRHVIVISSVDVPSGMSCRKRKRIKSAMDGHGVGVFRLAGASAWFNSVCKYRLKSVWEPCWTDHQSLTCAESGHQAGKFIFTRKRRRFD